MHDPRGTSCTVIYSFVGEWSPPTHGPIKRAHMFKGIPEHKQGLYLMAMLRYERHWKDNQRTVTREGEREG